MKKGKLIKRITLVLVILLIVAQFIRIDKTVPAHSVESDFLAITNPPKEIKTLLKNACYDCHSYETTYPWYSNIAPVSWWLKHHVNEGREHLNFSVWGDYSEKKKNHKLEECYEEVEEGEMPLKSYTLTHSDAKLSQQEVDLLVEWIKSIGNFADEHYEHEEHAH